jgi:MFS family permease
LPVLMTSLSPKMGSLAARIGPRLPLTVGPFIVAAGMAASLLMTESASYWAGAFPTIVIMAAGMTIAVAPLTASVLGSVEERHVAMASGFNSAVARTGGLIATALLGAVLASSGKQLFGGFHVAMLVSAAVAALSSLVALTTLRSVRMKGDA